MELSKELKMKESSSGFGGYLFAGAIGAIAGALTMVLASRAIPSMMSRMMSNMMAQMGGEGCDPEEM
jgi:hypothetical protein